MVYLAKSMVQRVQRNMEKHANQQFGEFHGYQNDGNEKVEIRFKKKNKKQVKNKPSSHDNSEYVDYEEV